MMAFAYRYHCIFCRVTQKTKKGWIHHLLSIEHQAAAQEDLVSWESPTKERVLVAFGDFSVATEAVLAAFSRDDGRSTLVGFVWNERRPKVGLLLFESREKVEQILKEEGNRMQIGNNHLLQLRKATDYLDLEWNALFVQDFCSALLKTEVDDDGTLPFPKRIKRAPTSENSSCYEADESTNAFSDTSSSDRDVLEGNAATVNDKTGVIKIEPQEEPGPSAVLGSQLDVLRSQTEIGNEAYNQALALMENCRRVLNTSFEGCKLFMFRNWCLKLCGGATPELYFYLDAEGVLDNVNGGWVFGPKSCDTLLPDGFLASFLNSAAAQRLLPGLRSRNGGEELGGFSYNGEPSMHRFQDLSTQLNLTLVRDPTFAIEAQTYRLLNYLLDFDPRARPFFSLISYWAEQNEAKLSNSPFDYYAPEGAGLDWLVIFFLCQKGILPTPREILERPHSEVRCSFFNHPLDIGFRMDSQFAQEWNAVDKANCPRMGSNEFVLQLIELSMEFFTFYGNFRDYRQGLVLNTKDGELIRYNRNRPNDTVTRLNQSELMLVINPAQGNQYNVNLALNRLNGLDSWNQRLDILQPINLQWKFVYDEENFFGKICGDMLASAKRIEDWLRNVDENRRSGADDWENVASLQELFRKVTEEELQPFMEVQRN